MSKKVINLKTILDYVQHLTGKQIKESKSIDEVKTIIDYNQHITDSKLEKFKEEFAIPGPRGIEGADGLDGEKGDQGIHGIQGEKGDTGEQGFRGPQGEQGIQGIQGIKGDKGIQGIQGEVGPQGEQGIKGIKGDTGEQGFKGTKGDKGDKGDKGNTGEQGIQGLQGDQGIQGIEGIQGKKGPKGNEGKQGLQGEVGPKGAKGAKGEQGEQGLKGDKGSKGTSFEFADLTDEQIKKLKGPKGKNFDKKLFDESLKNLDKEFNKRVRSMRQDINKTLDKAVAKSDQRDTQHRRENQGSGGSGELLVAGGGLSGSPESGYIEFIKNFDDERRRQFYPGQLILYYSEPSNPITEFDHIRRPIESQKGEDASFYRVVEEFIINDSQTPNSMEEAITLGYVVSITGGSGSGTGVSNTYTSYAGDITGITVGTPVFIDNVAKALARGDTYNENDFIKIANASEQYLLADGMVSKITGTTGNYSISVSRFGIVTSNRTDLEKGTYYLLATDGSITNAVPGRFVSYIQYVGQAISDTEIFVRFAIDPVDNESSQGMTLIPQNLTPQIPADNRDLIDTVNKYPLVGTVIFDDANDHLYIAVRDYTSTDTTEAVWTRLDTTNNW